MICCQQFVLYCQRWEEVRFIAIHVCLILKDGEKYDFVAAKGCLIPWALNPEF